MTRTHSAAVRKFRIERFVGRHLINPTVRTLDRLGVRTTLAAELETIGRKSGLRRVVPVSARFDEAGAWVISQHGARSGWTANLSSNPQVRIRQGERWRIGTAELVPDDDVNARARTFAPRPALASLTAASFRAMQSAPVSVRITFTDTP